jgi:serpin B
MTQQQRIHRISLGLLVMALAASALAGCAAPSGNVANADLLRSDKPRLAAPSLDEARVPELVAGNTQFALALYRELFSAERNLFYSPYSISAALAMTYAGARAETEQQMAEALHFTLPQAQLHAAFNALDQLLLSTADADDAEAFRLHIANTTWGQQGHHWLEAFLDTLAENYGAGLRQVDFRQAEETRRLINQWVLEQTEGKIEELLPAGAVDGETALVLTNAVYFKAAWKYAFAEAATQAGPFTLLDGSQVSVSMMTGLASTATPRGQACRPSSCPMPGTRCPWSSCCPKQAPSRPSSSRWMRASWLPCWIGWSGKLWR